MSAGLQHIRELEFPEVKKRADGYTDAVEYGHHEKRAETTSKPLTKVEISVVAIHGLHEDPISAWTEPESGILWLRDLIPLHIPKARILSFGYESSPSSYNNDRIAQKIQSIATTSGRP